MIKIEIICDNKMEGPIKDWTLKDINNELTKWVLEEPYIKSAKAMEF
jgi:hypothetical protein